MQRRHVIIPAVLLAGAAVVGGSALLPQLPLGAEPTGGTSPASEVLAPIDEAALAERTARLDAQAARLDAIAAQRPPALPPLARARASAAAPVRVATSPRASASTVVAASAPPTTTTTSTRGDDDDHLDDHGGDRDDRFDDDDHADDHGGDREDHDDHDDDSHDDD